jgi:hypothetical protein
MGKWGNVLIKDYVRKTEGASELIVNYKELISMKHFMKN